MSARCDSHYRAAFRQVALWGVLSCASPFAAAQSVEQAGAVAATPAPVGGSTPAASLLAAQDTPAAAASIGPALTLSPPSGVLVSTQRFDLVLILEWGNLQLTGGRALFDGADVTGVLLACSGIRLGAVQPVGASLRCPGLSAWELGPGYHRLEVELYFNDGSRLRDAVTWSVLEGRD